MYVPHVSLIIEEEVEEVEEECVGEEEEEAEAGVVKINLI